MDDNNRKYHVVAINERTGRETICTATPVNHKDGCTILGKFYPRPANSPKHVRIQLKEVA